MQKFSLSSTKLFIVCSLVLLQGSIHALQAKSPTFSSPEAVFLAYSQKEFGDSKEMKKEAHFLYTMLGAEFEAISFDKAQEMDLMGGVMIKKIFSGPLSQQSFIKEGFVITKINDQEVFTIRRLYNALKSNPQRIRLEGKYNDLLMEYDSFNGNYTYLLVLNESW